MDFMQRPYNLDQITRPVVGGLMAEIASHHDDLTGLRCIAHQAVSVSTG
jgi:hypothetical protein